MKKLVRFFLMVSVIAVASPLSSQALATTAPAMVGVDAQSYASGVQDGQLWKNSNPARSLPSRITFAQTKCDQYTSDPNDGARIYDPQLDDYWNGYLAGLQGELVD